MAKKKAKEEFKVPEELGTCADLLYTLRQDRLIIGQDVKEFEEREKLIKDYVINTLPKSNASGVAGAIAKVAVTTQDIPVVTDWDAFYKFVKRTNSFDLLQRRVWRKRSKSGGTRGRRFPVSERSRR